MVHLLDLPNEIIVNILCNLSFYDIFPCQRACRNLNATIKESSLLQYQCALELGALDNNPNHNKFSVIERLEKLNASAKAWMQLQPDFVESIEVHHDPSGIYDLTGGVYLLGNVNRHELHYTCLPSTLSDDTSWYTIKIKESIIDMGLCIEEHDLTAIVTTSPTGTIPSTHNICITLLEFSTGRPHPLARETKIPIYKNRWERPAIGIEIVGENLVLILTHYANPWQPDDRVFVFNWRTGAVKMTLVAPYHTYAGLIFLTEHLILLPNTHKGTLEIWEIPRNAGDPSPTVPLCILSLPALAPGQVFGNLSCRCEPNPMGAGSTPRSTRRPYTCKPQEAIIIFNLRVQPANGQPANLHFGHTYSFFIHRKSILECMEEELQSSTRRGGASMNTIDIDFPNSSVLLPTPVPWAKWGPTVTRWITADSVPTRWITTSAGQRCVLIADIARDAGFQYIVLDFNSANVKKRMWFERDRDLRKAAQEKKIARTAEDGEGPSDVEKPSSKSKDSERMLPGPSGLPIPAPIVVGEDSDSDDEWEDTDSEDGGGPMEDQDDDETRALVMRQIQELMDQNSLPFQFAGPSTSADIGGGSTSSAEDEESADATATVSTPPAHDDVTMESIAPLGADNETTEAGRAASARTGNDVDSDGDDRIWCITDMQVVDAGHSFSEPVVSHLPYVACASNEKHFYDGVLMDEERVLGLVTDPLDRIQSVQVHHFG